MSKYLFADRTQYQVITGTKGELPELLQFLQLTYHELYPHQPDYQHLQMTIERYFSEQSPVWFVTDLSSDPALATKIACLWWGMAIDQITGERHPNIFLLYVDPAYRRQGIGRALMQQVEVWAQERGYHQIGLQVFTTDRAAIALYQQLGYQPRSISMMREL